MNSEHLDEAVDIIRQLADEQAPAPLSEAELDGLLASLPPELPAARPRPWVWTLAAAAVLAFGLVVLTPEQVEPERDGPPMAALSIDEPERIEIRMATGDPSISVVWVMTEDFEL